MLRIVECRDDGDKVLELDYNFIYRGIYDEFTLQNLPLRDEMVMIGTNYRCYVISDNAESLELRRKIQKFTVSEAKRIGKKLLDILKYISSKSLDFHVSPSKIFVNDDGQYFIQDWQTPNTCPTFFDYPVC